MADSRVIKKATIVPEGQQNTIHVEYTNGEKGILFSYYPDQMTFISAEFVGISNDDAQVLFKKRDDLFHTGV